MLIHKELFTTKFNSLRSQYHIIFILTLRSHCFFLHLISTLIKVQFKGESARAENRGWPHPNQWCHSSWFSSPVKLPCTDITDWADQLIVNLFLKSIFTETSFYTCTLKSKVLHFRVSPERLRVAWRRWRGGRGGWEGEEEVGGGGRRRLVGWPADWSGHRPAVFVRPGSR